MTVLSKMVTVGALFAVAGQAAPQNCQSRGGHHERQFDGTLKSTFDKGVFTLWKTDKINIQERHGYGYGGMRNEHVSYNDAVVFEGEWLCGFKLEFYRPNENGDDSSKLPTMGTESLWVGYPAGQNQADMMTGSAGIVSYLKNTFPKKCDKFHLAASNIQPQGTTLTLQSRDAGAPPSQNDNFMVGFDIFPGLINYGLGAVYTPYPKPGDSGLCVDDDTPVACADNLFTLKPDHKVDLEKGNCAPPKIDFGTCDVSMMGVNKQKSGKKYCTAFTDPHMLSFGAGTRWEMPYEGDYIFYTNNPATNTKRSIDIQMRIEKYIPSVGWSAVTGVVFQGPLTCGMKVEVFSNKRKSEWLNARDRDAYVRVSGKDPVSRLPIDKIYMFKKLSDVTAYRSQMMKCDNICSISTVAEMMNASGVVYSQGIGMMSILFKGGTHFIVENYRGWQGIGANSRYSMDLVLYVPEELRGSDVADFGYIGACHVGGIVKAECPSNSVEPGAGSADDYDPTTDMFSDTFGSVENQAAVTALGGASEAPDMMCSRRRRLADGSGVGGKIPVADVIATRENDKRLYKKSRKNCDPELLAKADEACSPCKDENDETISDGTEQCVFDICQGGSLDDASHSTAQCEFGRNAATTPAKRDALVEHQSSTYDQDSNEFLDMTEFNQMLTDSGLALVQSADEFKALLEQIDDTADAADGFSAANLKKLYAHPQLSHRFNTVSGYKKLVKDAKIPEIPEEKLLAAELATALPLNKYKFKGDGLCAVGGVPGFFMFTWPEYTAPIAHTELECAKHAFENRGKVIAFSYNLEGGACMLYTGSSDFAVAGFKTLPSDDAKVTGAIDSVAADEETGTKCYVPVEQVACDVQCAANKVVDRTELCAGLVCQDSDKAQCCTKKAVCDDRVQCVEGTFLDDAAFCAGQKCKQSDRPTCCKAQKACDLNCAAIAPELSARLDAFCDSDTCDAQTDETRCCWENPNPETPEPTMAPTIAQKLVTDAPTKPVTDAPADSASSPDSVEVSSEDSGEVKIPSKELSGSYGLRPAAALVTLLIGIFALL